MKLLERIVYVKRQGAVLIISMIFILIFSALAVSMATLSGTNVQLASNQHKVNCALASAESGLQVMRYWLSRVTMPSSTQPSDYLSTIIDTLQNDLAANSISNITVNLDGSIQPVTLDSGSQQIFDGGILIDSNDPNILQVYTTGRSGQITRTIRVNYNIEPYRHPIFDYGIATKGPLHIQGNVDVNGLNESAEADIYIESEYDLNALSMTGNASIAGDVSIVNPDAIVGVSSSSSIGGETGQDAIDNHVTIGVPSTDFPIPNPAAFEHYIENIFDPNTDTTKNITLENIRIPAGTNPHFTSNVILRGIVFIESPNVVKFNAGTEITGIIIGDGNLDFPSEENQLIFRGHVQSRSVSELPDEERFSGIKQETGTFILAPGFSASFGGSFGTINGVIAASAIEFFGNAGGTINGSVINYADTPMTLRGNSNLVFNHSALAEHPAGFETTKVLEFQPSTYSELPL